MEPDVDHSYLSAAVGSALSSQLLLWELVRESGLAIPITSERTRHVLLVAYYFPPYESAGYSIRTVKFLKYLARGPYRFTVLTVDGDRAVQAPESHTSSELLAEVPTEVRVHRIAAPWRLPTLPASGFLGCRWHDLVLSASELIWADKICREGFRIAAQDPIDLVYATAPQNTALAAARKLKLRLGCPLLIDFRDDWVGGLPYLRKPRWLQRVHEALERRIVDAADKVVVVTESSRLHYCARYPERACDIRLITNGVDLDEFRVVSPNESADPGKFVILTAGGYPLPHRDPGPVLAAVGRLLRRRPQLLERLRLRFIGKWLRKSYSDPELAALGVDRVVEEIPSLPRTQLVQVLKRANILFCISSKNAHRAVPGKFYEYWAAQGGPILVLDDGGGATRELVERHSIGAAFVRSDVSAIERQIEQWVDAWLAGSEVRVPTDCLDAYDRSRLAVQMGELLAEMCRLPHP